MEFSLSRKDFPKGFLFGAATAAYQIEGTSFGEVGPSHWDSFAATPGNVTGGEDGRIACDHYHRYEEDLDLVRDAGFDAYRFSTSWPRIMPDGRTASQAGLDFYDRLADAILARGLKPFLTLYHWDLPATLSDLGGWANRDVADRFADYTETVIGRIGDRMASVATINEPWCVAWLGHFEGHHAPGIRNIRHAVRAMHHVLLAHGRSMEVMRAAGQEDLGIVLNFEPSHPASDDPADAAAAHARNGIYNRWFIEALMTGRYPEDILQAVAPYMPEGYEDDLRAIARPLDRLGINYYTRSIMAHAPDLPWPHYRAVEGPLPRTAMGWEVFPQGLHDILSWLRTELTGDLPLYVTENGMADNGAIEDAARIAYHEAHLETLLQAISDGAPVRGYFAWSLLDNYEWAHGYAKRFGIVHVDHATRKRTPKASWRAFRAALAG